MSGLDHARSRRLQRFLLRERQVLQPFHSEVAEPKLGLGGRADGNLYSAPH